MATFPLRCAVLRSTWVGWARERRRRENLTGEGTGTCKRQVMGGWMGVGRAGESERTCSPSCGSMSSVDLDHESPTRRRPVRVRRRRSQRCAERGERSEGGKCQRTIGSIVRGAPPREPIKRAPGPQTIEPISPQCLCPSHRTQRETSPPRRTLPMVGVLFSRCGEGWLWVSQGSSELRGDPPSMAPTHRQRDGAPQKAAHCPYFLRVSGNIFDGVCPTSRQRSSYHVCATTEKSWA